MTQVAMSHRRLYIAESRQVHICGIAPVYSMLWLISITVFIHIWRLLYFSGMQEAFDRDVKNGWITRDGWNNSATSDGRLGYKLIVQTGEADNPIDKRRVSTI